MRSARCIALICVAVLCKPLLAPPATSGPASTYLSADERNLRAVHLPTTGPALLDFLRLQMRSEADPIKLKTLIAQLSDKKPAVQQTAMAELVAIGFPAIPVLRPLANNLDDLEAVERARRCLQHIEGNMAAPLLTSTVRLVAQRKPPEAAKVLLEYIPFASDENISREVQSALIAVALRDGALDPALLAGLEDKEAIRRRAAVVAVCQVGKPEHFEAVRRLYRDPKPTVRLRAALGLANRHEQDAIPLLITLLGELPLTQRREAETYLASLAGEWAIHLPQGNDATAARLRQELWATWWRETTGAEALKEIKRRIVPDDERARIVALIQKFGSDDSAVRERAFADLLMLGSQAAPLLRQAVQDTNLAIKQFATKCLQIIDKDAPAPLPLAALRIAMLRRPEGTTEALLGYLPCAESMALQNQVQTALGIVAFSGNRPSAILVRALTDAEPQRRIVAAELIIQQGGSEQSAQLRKLLRDADANVRYRVAQAMADQMDKEAIPVLIALLTEITAEHAFQIEDYLQYVAGSNAPAVYLDRDETARTKCRAAWEGWWKNHGAALDLAKHENLQKSVGNTLIVEQYDASQRTGRVIVVDAGGQVLWQIESLQYPMDAQLLSDDRVLIAEQGARTVTERDSRNNVLWQRPTPTGYPIGCQRLANGNTFITANNRLVEVDKSGKEVFVHTRTSNDITAARKLRNGHVAFFTSTGSYVRVDENGKEQKTFRVSNPQNYYYGGVVQFLPNDHLLVPQFATGGKLLEYDGQGKVVREIAIPVYPTSVVRMPNGHLLLASSGTQNVVELDRKGKTLWEFKNPSVRPYRARRVER